MGGLRSGGDAENRGGGGEEEKGKGESLSGPGGGKSLEDGGGAEGFFIQGGGAPFNRRGVVVNSDGAPNSVGGGTELGENA